MNKGVWAPSLAPPLFNSKQGAQSLRSQVMRPSVLSAATSTAAGSARSRLAPSHATGTQVTASGPGRRSLRGASFAPQASARGNASVRVGAPVPVSVAPRSSPSVAPTAVVATASPLHTYRGRALPGRQSVARSAVNPMLQLGVPLSPRPALPTPHQADRRGFATTPNAQFQRHSPHLV